MHTTTHPLSPPSLDELADVLRPALEKNFSKATISVEQCPDLRKTPFHLAAEGLSGNEVIADIGGQPNLFPEPRLDCKYDLLEIAKEMNMSPERGQLLGAGAGPFHVIGVNSELSPNLSWETSFSNVKNLTYYTKVDSSSSNNTTPSPICSKSPSSDCALMMNLYGSTGLPGPVLKITARTRIGSHKSFTECLRSTLQTHYGTSRTISLGGAFLIKQGKAHFHIMPDFPSHPFENAAQLNNWLTYHDFDAPIVCLSVFHSADPGKKLGLRMEHTHSFSTNGSNAGGHYHYDLEAGEDGEEVEYEGYFNVARMLYRVDKPVVTLERDLHD